MYPLPYSSFSALPSTALELSLIHIYRMLNMAKENNITFVMVTHERDLAAVADRVVTIKDGKVESDMVMDAAAKAAAMAEMFSDIMEQEAPAEPNTTVPLNSEKQ